VVREWDTHTGQQVKAREYSGDIVGLSQSPDGTVIAVILDSRVVLRGEDLEERSVETGAVWDVALGGVGNWMVSVGKDGMIQTWDTKTGRMRCTLEGGGGEAWAVAVSSDERWIVSGDLAGDLRVWDATTAGRCAASRWRSHSDPL
jgi:WD40 repeat protein